MAKQSGKAGAVPKKRAKAVLRPREKKEPVEPVQSRPHTVDPEKLEMWRSLPEDQRVALREREAARMFNNAAILHREGKLEPLLAGQGQA